MAVAKKNVKKKPIGGPFLAAAVFCDNILQGADGALSAIRIVDKVSVAVPPNAPANTPSESTKLQVAISTLLMFKSGSAKGEHEVHLAIHSPSGKRASALKHKLVFGDRPNGGANLKIQLSLAIAEGGLYMVDVLLDGKRVTRMPLDISVTREEDTPSEPVKPKRALRAKPKRTAKRKAKRKRG